MCVCAPTTIASGLRSMFSIWAVGWRITVESIVAHRGACRSTCMRAQSKRRATRANHLFKVVSEWLEDIVRAHSLALLSTASLENPSAYSLDQVSFRLLRSQESNNFAESQFVKGHLLGENE